MTPSIESDLKKSPPTTRERLLTTFHVMVVLFGFLVCFAAYWVGLLYNVLNLLVIVLLFGMGFSRAFGSCWDSLEYRFVRRPFDRSFRKYLLQCLNIWVLMILTLVTVRLAIVPIQFSPEKYRTIQMIMLGSAGIVMLLALVPHKKVRFSTNIFFAVGWLFLGMQLFRILLPGSGSEAVVLASPFVGESYIFNGGRSTLINHHYSLSAQRYALDIIKTIDGRENDRDKGDLESYPAWGDILYAPADGEVVKVVNDRPDMAIGETDSKQILGNHVVLDIGQGQFVLMAHLKEGSVRVSLGDKIKQGEALAECGNSGNTSAPHLHLQVQSQADFHAGDLRTFPINFRNVTRVRSGRRAELKEADVRRNDILLATEVGEGGGN